MQTQRDRVHAYNFLIGRMSAALASADPTPPEPPDKRHRFGLACGVVLALLIGVGFWVYGLLFPGGSTVWQQQGAILVEKETGNRYLYLDGALHPVLNQASAMLVQGSQAHVETISRSSLSGLRHGAPIGIPGAPDAVPTAQGLTGGPWLLCLTDAGPERAAMSMVLDPRGIPQPLAADRYVLVTSAGGTLYLVLDGTKYQLGDPSVLVALGVQAVKPERAPQAWLDSVANGPTLAAARLPAAPEPGAQVAGRPWNVGTLFRQRMLNGGEEYWVLRGDGLAPMSATEFALASARHPELKPVAVTAGDVAAAPRSADTSLLGRLPNLTDVTLAAGLGAGELCLVQVPLGMRVVSAVAVNPVRHSGSPLEEGATVPPNKGMLAVSVPLAPGQKTATRYLITDRGIRYPVPDDQALGALGFGGVAPTPVPQHVLDALPTGPALSVAAAARLSQEG
jgi:type VII secretion protein EccB